LGIVTDVVVDGNQCEKFFHFDLFCLSKYRKIQRICKQGKIQFLLLDSRDFDEFCLFPSTFRTDYPASEKHNPGVFVLDGVLFAVRATVVFGDFHSDFLG
jgi:hypothetical protein